MQTLENPPTNDQATNRILRFIDTQQSLFARTGSVVKSWRYFAGRRLGPYYCLLYRERGKQRRKYVGRSVRDAKVVSSRLAELQRERDETRALARLRRYATDATRGTRRNWHDELEKVGFEGKGSEVRRACNLPKGTG